MIDLADLRAKANAATQGKWVAKDFTVAAATDKHAAIHTMKLAPIQHRVLGSLDPQDAEFIVAVQPSTILALLARLEAAETALGRFTDAVELDGRT